MSPVSGQQDSGKGNVTKAEGEMEKQGGVATWGRQTTVTNVSGRQDSDKGNVAKTEGEMETQGDVATWGRQTTVTNSKGSRCVIKLTTLPILTPERKSARATPINFKDNKKYINAPPPAVVEEPAEVAPAVDMKITKEEFYGTLDHEKSALSQKQSNVQGNIELRSSEVAKLSRKIAKGVHFIDLLKERVNTCYELDCAEDEEGEGAKEREEAASTATEQEGEGSQILKEVQ